jgi:hypothetical protein
MLNSQCISAIFVARLNRVTNLEFQKVIILHLLPALAGILSWSRGKVLFIPHKAGVRVNIV